MSGLIASIKSSFIVHICFAISFFTSGLVINAAQCCLYLLLKPINKKLYRTINYYLCYSFYSQLVAIGEWWSGSKLYYYITEEDWKLAGKEHILLMMNHTYEVDWLFGWFYTEKAGWLGNCKAYAKKVISYIPAVGWSWKFAEFVFLERSFDKDKVIIERQLDEIFDYPDPVALLLNAEGTRFTPSKHEASVKFAQERGMTVLNHHLIPRTKGFTASLSVLKKKCPAILDVQIMFDEADETKPTVMNVIKGKPITGHIYLRRIPMSEVPDDEEEAAKWLQELFVRKDKLMSSFHKTGDLFKGNDIEPIKPMMFERRIYPLINWLTWMVIAMVPILWLLISLLSSGDLTHIIIGAVILVTFSLLLKYATNMSEISKSSNYGRDEQKNGKVKAN